MAKGQLRGNKEAKKPKQSNKPTPIAAPSGASSLKPAAPVAAAPKKR